MGGERWEGEVGGIVWWNRLVSTSVAVVTSFSLMDVKILMVWRSSSGAPLRVSVAPCSRRFLVAFPVGIISSAEALFERNLLYLCRTSGVLLSTVVLLLIGARVSGVTFRLPSKSGSEV